MDFARLGTVFRAVRLKKTWRQIDVATKAGVTRSSVSRLERGHARELRLDELAKIAEALDISLRILATWRGGELDRLLNLRHSGLHESVALWFQDRAGWVVAQEVSYSIFGERGTIDILAWHATTRTLLVIELKTEIVDVNELIGKVDQKRRLAADIVRDRGWIPKAVAVWVIVAMSRTNRRRVAQHKTTLRSAFPADGRTVVRWVAEPSGSVAALSYWPDAPGEITNARLATVKRVRKPPAEAA